MFLGCLTSSFCLFFKIINIFLFYIGVYCGCGWKTEGHNKILSSAEFGIFRHIPNDVNDRIRKNA